MRKLFWTILTLTALILSLTGCANHIETFDKYVREGNFTDAITLYQEKLSKDSNSYAACQELVHTYLDESLLGYSQGDLSQTQMEAVLHTMEMLEDYLYLVDNLEDGYTDYVILKDSKANFRRAEALRKDGRLEDAMEAYSAVLPEDAENYSTARENMDALLTKINDDAHNAIIQAYEGKDYPAVFLAYRAAEQNRHVTITEDLTEIYEAAAMEYMLSAAEQAEQAFGGDAKDYQAALEVLLRAKAAVSEEPDLLAELEAMAEAYKAYIPVNLHELIPIQQRYTVDVGTYHSDISTDISGNTYLQKSVISPCDLALTDDEGYVTYNLNFAFSTFTATVYRPYGYLSYPEEILPNRAGVRIYGDDVLLYEFVDPGDTWEAFPIEVDVSGVRNLKIVIRGVWNRNTALLAPDDPQPRICLAEGVLQK